MNHILFLFICMVAVQTETRAQDFSDIVSRLFSVSCDNDEELYSEWTRCVWPSGDLRPLVVNFTRDARKKGCKMPPPKLIGVALRALRGADYINHPLYRKIPDSECGFCGRKAQCCTKARSFLTQSFRSDNCDGESLPCLILPLDREDRAALTDMYGADFAHPDSSCDFTPYVVKELDRLHSSGAFKFVKPLMCQILGTTKPSLSCTNVNGHCRCCCQGFTFENGLCTADPNYEQNDSDC